MADVFGPVFGPTFGYSPVEPSPVDLEILDVGLPVPIAKPVDLQVLIRNVGRTIVDELARDVPWTVDLTLRANYADDGTITLPASESRYTSLLAAPGTGVVVLLGDDVLTSGWVTAHGTEATAGEPVPTFTATFIGDSSHIVGHAGFPSPAAAPTAQGVYYASPYEPAETALIRNVNEQAGPTARAELRIAGLVLPASQGRGPSRRTFNVRYTPMGDVLRALAKDDLGFRLVHDAGTTLRLHIWQPADRSSAVTFSAPRGTLPGFSFTAQAPQWTRVLVLAGGEGAARIVREYADTAAEVAYGFRAWHVVDRRDVNPTDDPDYETTLATEGADGLREGGAQASLTLSPILPSDGIRFGPAGDLWLLDKVGVEFADGASSTEVVRAMHVTYGPDGLAMEPIVGGPEAADPTPEDVRRVTKLQATLLRLLAGQ